MPPFVQFCVLAARALHASDSRFVTKHSCRRLDIARCRESSPRREAGQGQVRSALSGRAGRSPRGYHVTDMDLTIETERPPLTLGHDGVVRVAATRVTLDTLVAAFRQGATAEEMAHQYPSLELADVYAVIAYYLRRRPEVDAYIEARRSTTDGVRAENESRFDPHGIRERLIARRGH